MAAISPADQGFWRIASAWAYRCGGVVIVSVNFSLIRC